MDIYVYNYFYFVFFVLKQKYYRFVFWQSYILVIYLRKIRIDQVNDYRVRVSYFGMS